MTPEEKVTDATNRLNELANEIRKAGVQSCPLHLGMLVQTVKVLEKTLQEILREHESIKPQWGCTKS